MDQDECGCLHFAEAAAHRDPAVGERTLSIAHEETFLVADVNRLVCRLLALHLTEQGAKLLKPYRQGSELWPIQQRFEAFGLRLMTPGSGRGPASASRGVPLAAQCGVGDEWDTRSVDQPFDSAPSTYVPIIAPDLEYLDAVLPPKLGAETVWHYTDAAGLLGIVSGDAIRAGAIWAMNDRSEFTYGADLIRAVLKEQGGELEREEDVAPLLHFGLARLQQDSAYIACASREENSLSQWRAYGSYAVAINAGIRLQVRTGEQGPPEAVEFTWELGEAQRAADAGWRDVVYGKSEQKEMVGRLLLELDQLAPFAGREWDAADRADYKRCLSLIIHTVPYLKHPAFAAEQEVRLFVNYESHAPGIKLRAGRLGIASFVELEARQALLKEVGQAMPGTYRPRRFPIQKVQIGPGVPDVDVAKQGVKTALQIHGFDKEVETVDSPLR